MKKLIKFDQFLVRYLISQFKWFESNSKIGCSLEQIETTC